MLGVIFAMDNNVVGNVESSFALAEYLANDVLV